VVHPTIEVGGVQVIRVKLKIPFRGSIIGDCGFRDLSGPGRTEPFHIRQTGDAQSVLPLQPSLAHLQRADSTLRPANLLIHINMPLQAFIPPHCPLIIQYARSRTG